MTNRSRALILDSPTTFKLHHYERFRFCNYQITQSPNYSITQLLNYQITQLPNYSITKLLNYQITQLPISHHHFSYFISSSATFTASTAAFTSCTRTMWAPLRIEA